MEVIDISSFRGSNIIYINEEKRNFKSRLEVSFGEHFQYTVITVLLE